MGEALGFCRFDAPAAPEVQMKPIPLPGLQGPVVRDGPATT
jgi:hypothetical protein